MVFCVALSNFVHVSFRCDVCFDDRYVFDEYYDDLDDLDDALWNEIFDRHFVGLNWGH